MVNNFTINTKGTERGLDKLESVIGMKNPRHSRILNHNPRDKVGERSENLKVVAKKVDPTHTSIVINKHDIVAVTRNRGGTRGTPNVEVKKIKRCKRGNVIVTRVRRSMIFAQLT